MTDLKKQESITTNQESDLKQLRDAETKGKKVDIVQKVIEYLANTSGDFIYVV